MPDTAMTRRTAKLLVRLIIIGLLVQLAMICYVFYSAYQRRVDAVADNRAGCERNKLDRADNARFQTAQTGYIASVTGALSVKEDVKTAARKAIVVFRQTSADLNERARIDCTKAFPDPTLFP